MCYFKIWYTDKIVEGTSLEDWKNAPYDGVVIVYEKFPNGTSRVAMGSDWYWMLSDENVYQSGVSTFRYDNFYTPHNAPDGAFLKKGRWVSDEQYAEMMAELEILITSI